MTKIVSNERGFIDFDRFNEFCESNERHLRAQFDRFDTEKMGVLNVSEMKHALREAGVEVCARNRDATCSFQFSCPLSEYFELEYFRSTANIVCTWAK